MKGPMFQGRNARETGKRGKELWGGEGERWPRVEDETVVRRRWRKGAYWAETESRVWEHNLEGGKGGEGSGASVDGGLRRGGQRKGLGLEHRPIAEGWGGKWPYPHTKGGEKGKRNCVLLP